MDPNTCLFNLMTAFAEGDTDRAVASMDDLTRWLESGGFMPDVVWIVDAALGSWEQFSVRKRSGTQHLNDKETNDA